MEIFVNPSSFLYLYLFLSLLYLTVVTSFSPLHQYLIDCGSTKPTTVYLDNRQFTGDSSDSGSRFLSATRSVSVADVNPDLNSSPIYHTARVFTRPSKYVFEIREKGTYLLRLHFHLFDTSKIKSYTAQFHVSVNHHLLMYNYTAENTQNPIVKDYMIWIDTGNLEIRFAPLDDSKIAFINAIEVISAPKDLIADVAQFVNSEKNEKISGLTKNSLETVHRINVGGPKVTPFNDSLWRTWLPDNEFLKSSGEESNTVYFGGRVNYQLGGASREVGPDNVYNTARVIKSSNNFIPHLNITWIFPVKEGYKYLTRLHFCDIASVALGELYFNVYINGNVAYENLDLTMITNGRLASPFYADFVVDVGNSGLLTIDVGPSNKSMDNAIDAMLNGIEIMKINDSFGNLDEFLSAVRIRRTSWNIGVIVPFIAAMSLLITLYMTILKKLVGMKNSIGWSPLPIDGYEVELKSGSPLIFSKV